MREMLGRASRDSAEAAYRRRAGLRIFAAAMAVLLISSAGWGQKKKKNQDQPVDNTPMPKLPMATPDQIDDDIGQMLAAFQVGDVEMMHKYYADNATFVRGTYEPPVLGWQNYVPLYQQQRAAFGGFQLIRRDTSIFLNGNIAWATYSWEFDALYQGRPYSARGHTTLIFNKVGENWLIVHNHTSQICDAASAQLRQQAPAQAPPPEAPKP